MLRILALAWLAAYVPAVAAVPLIAAGGSQSLYQDARGALWVWGYRGRGQPDDHAAAQPHPALLRGLQGISEAALSSEYHFVVLMPDASVRAWGWNFYGQLGDGTTSDRPRARKISLARSIQAAAGGDFTLALDEQGAVWAWG